MRRKLWNVSTMIISLSFVLDATCNHIRKHVHCFATSTHLLGLVVSRTEFDLTLVKQNGWYTYNRHEQDLKVNNNHKLFSG